MDFFTLLSNSNFITTVETTRGLVVVDWIKTADDASGDIIVRIHEAIGGRAEATLRVADALAGAAVRETGVLETNALADDLPRALQTEADAPVPAEGAALRFGPFQLATLRIARP